MEFSGKKLVLNQEQIYQKIRRIAYQIYENNAEEPALLLAGIQGSGFEVAHLLKAELEAILEIPIRLIRVSLDKDRPIQSEVSLDQDISSLQSPSVIVIDDVLHTGRTLSYSLKPFLTIRVKKLQTVVLVDRQYRQFPIAADYVGFAMSTTPQERVEVFLKEDRWGVYLS